MKRIFVFRHAKAEKSATLNADHERALVNRGRADALEMAKWIGYNGLRPALVLCSSATRTQQTYQIIHDALPALPQAQITPNLYLASAGDILYEVNRIKGDYNSVMIVGHNPGLKEFCVQLANDERAHVVDAIALSFPTCALAIFDVPCDAWDNIVPAMGQVVDYMHPARLPEISS